MKDKLIKKEYNKLFKYHHICFIFINLYSVYRISRKYKGINSKTSLTIYFGVNVIYPGYAVALVCKSNC